MLLNKACLLTYREGIFVFLTKSILKEDPTSMRKYVGSEALKHCVEGATTKCPKQNTQLRLGKRYLCFEKGKDGKKI